MRGLFTGAALLTAALTAYASPSPDPRTLQFLDQSANRVEFAVPADRIDAIKRKGTDLKFTASPNAAKWDKRRAAAHKKFAARKGKKALKTTSSKGFTVLEHAKYPQYKLRVKRSSELCDPSVKQISGYLDVNEDQHYFFWFFESRNDPVDDPVVLWLNGGPGCSSLTGLLMELGPCRVAPGGNDTVYNPYSWNNKANVIFLDQPIGVGFSYTDGEAPNSMDSVEAAKNVYAFLQIFLEEFEDYAISEFHITGESYAGHYLPAIADEIIKGNYELPDPTDPEYPDDPEPEEPELLFIDLQSVAIGNGLTDPLVQYKYYADFAEDTKYGPILEEDVITGMRNKYPTCATLISACYNFKSPLTCIPAGLYCEYAIVSPFQKTGLNIYDVRKKCDENNDLCYEILNDVKAYLNRKDVQEALGVDRNYESCDQSTGIRFLLSGDHMLPYQDLISGILAEGVRVLIYAGDADFICNWIGNKAWILELEWEGKEGFNEADDLFWVSRETGDVAGEVRSFEGLTYLRVYEAGHMVPYDQPANSAAFIEAWLVGDEL